MSQCMNLQAFAGAAAAFAIATTASAGFQSGSSDDQVRATVAEMLADAEGRTSLLQSGNAGHDGKNFFLSSSSGDFNLKIKGQIQFRYILNFGDDDPSNPAIPNPRADDVENGFQTRRTKLSFEGNAFDNMDYRVRFAFDRNGGAAGLEEAWVRYNWDGGWGLRWGQFKLPFLREELVSSSAQLAVERSYTNDIFSQDYSQGIELQYKAEQWAFWFAFSDGFGSRNSEFTSDGAIFLGDTTTPPDGVADANGFGGFGFVGTGESDFALTARFEFLGGGTWGQFKDFTGMPGDEFGWLIGAALHWESVDEGVVTTAAGNGEGDSDFFGWTVDASFEGDGWNIYAAYMGTSTDIDFDPGTDPAVDGSSDPVDHGFVVQGGFFFPDTDWELFGRYDIQIFDDDERAFSDDNFSTLTFGVNNYIHGHAAKFTADVVYYIDDLNNIRDTDTGSGRVGGGDDDEWAIRLQFQLLF